MMNRNKYKEEDYIKKCTGCKHHRQINFMDGHVCNLGLITRNRCDYKVYKSCPDYVPIKNSALSDARLKGLSGKIPSEFLPYHNEYIANKVSGYCNTHNCKACSLNEHCRVDCYEDVAIGLESHELLNLANVHHALESICAKRFNDCRICPLSCTGNKEDCYITKFLDSNIQALNGVCNDLSEQEE